MVIAFISHHSSHGPHDSIRFRYKMYGWWCSVQHTAKNPSRKTKKTSCEQQSVHISENIRPFRYEYWKLNGPYISSCMIRKDRHRLLHSAAATRSKLRRSAPAINSTGGTPGAAPGNTPPLPGLAMTASICPQPTTLGRSSANQDVRSASAWRASWTSLQSVAAQYPAPNAWQ